MRVCHRVTIASVALVLVVSAVWAAERTDDPRVFCSPEPPAQAKLGDVWVSPKGGAEMVYVPEGEFMMGSTEADIAALLKQDPMVKAEWLATERPQFRASLPGYWIDKYEVTVARYRAFCKETGGKMPNSLPWGCQDDHPMVNVTWQEATAYAKWAGKRLPTEMEWEKAARGTDGRRYPWGNHWPPPAGSGNFADQAFAQKDPDVARVLTEAGIPPLRGYDDGYAEAAPVGRFPAGASPCGALDMAGNVWEWCADSNDEEAYQRYAKGDLTPPKSTSDKVIRGGSWSGGDPTFSCAFRLGNSFGNRSDSGGFRCVRGLP